MNDFLELLRKTGRTAFRTKEFTAFMKSKSYARVALHRLKKQGKIVSVKNGIWAFPDALPESIACEISLPCYVSFHSALSLHGLTTQSSRIIQLAVARNGKTYSLLGEKVKEYKIPKQNFQGFYNDENLFLAKPEKAFADCLQIPRACPESILREALPSLDERKIKQWLSKKALKRLEALQ